MEGKGETRLRNEQASENKVEARSRTGKKRAENKILFSARFSKTCRNVSNSDRASRICLISALAPLSVAGLPVVPDSARPGLCFFCSPDMSEREGLFVVIRFRRRGGKTK